MEEEIKKIENNMISWRRLFHEHPEISQKEFETSKTIRSILSEAGISYKPIGETGTLGEIRGTKNSSDKIISLRADIDALPINEESDPPYKSLNPNAMHACGHDAHTASLLGAAVMLKKHVADFSGTVRLIFEPSEEIGGGALLMIANGALDGAGMVIGIHMWPELEYGKIDCTAGPVMAGCDILNITIAGKGGHISYPHKASNPILSAAQIVTSLQSIINQRFAPDEEVLIGIGEISGGKQYNIIPEKVNLSGTIRTFTKENHETAIKSVTQIAENTAAAYSNQAFVNIKTITDPVINSAAASALGRKAAEKVVGKDNVIIALPKSLAGDDFCYYQQKVPGLYAKIGSSNSNIPGTQHPLHHSQFDIDERALVIAASFYYQCVMAYLNE